MRPRTKDSGSAAQSWQIHHEGAFELAQHLALRLFEILQVLVLAALRNSPPRISSQFGPQTILSIGWPEIKLRGRAVGVAFISGADADARSRT